MIKSCLTCSIAMHASRHSLAYTQLVNRMPRQKYLSLFFIPLPFSLVICQLSKPCSLQCHFIGCCILGFNLPPLTWPPPSPPISVVYYYTPELCRQCLEPGAQPNYLAGTNGKILTKLIYALPYTPRGPCSRVKTARTQVTQDIYHRLQARDRKIRRGDRKKRER